MPNKNDIALVRAALYSCPGKGQHPAEDCPICEAVATAHVALARIAKRYQGLQRIPIPAAEYVKTPEPGSRARLIGVLDAWDQLDQSLKGAQ